MKNKIKFFIFALLTLGLGLSTYATIIDSVCSGSSKTIGFIHTDGPTYLWSTGAMTAQITVSPLVTTLYVQHWDDTLFHQVAVHDTFLVVVKSRPTVFISQNYVMCPGNCDSLVAHTNAYPTTYQWYGGGIMNNPFLYPMSAGNALSICAWNIYYDYSIIGTYINGCSDTAEFVTQIQGFPTQYSITGNATYLPGQPGVNLGLSGSEATCYYVLYQYGVPIDTINGTGAPITFGMYLAGSYMVRGYRSPSCYTQTNNFSVSTATITTTSVVDSVCKGSSITIGTMITNGYLYSWNTGANTPSISVNPTINTVFTRTVLNSNFGIILQDTFSIIVKQVPVVLITGTSSIICLGGSSILTAHSDITTPMDYVWNTGANTSSITVNPTTITSYSVTGTASNSCSNGATFALVVQALPIMYTIIGNGTYCSNQPGDTVKLNGTESDCYYTLYKNGLTTTNTVHGTGFPINFGPQPAGIYTVNAFKDNLGCQSQMLGSVTVTVAPIPGNISFSVPISSPCEGQSVIYGPAISLNASSYLWSVPNGATITSGQGTNMCTINWGNSAGGTVSISGMNACGIGQAMTFTVVVNPKPTLSLSSTTSSLCSGGSATLTAISNANSYLWSTGATTSSISVNPGVGSYTYTMQVTGGTGCINSGFINITVNPLPNVTLTASPNTICSGGSAILTANGANTYIWSNSLGTGNTKTVSPLITTSYMVTGTDGNGCSNTASTTVIVSPIPGPITSFVGDTIVCEGATISYGVSPTTNTSSYSWAIPSGATLVSGQGTVNVSINWGNSLGGILSVAGINSCGSGPVKIITITVKPQPTLSIVTSSSSICNGQSAALTAVSNAVSYAWNTGATTASIPVNPINTTSIPVTFSYNVFVIGSNSCVNSGTTSITVNPKPIVTLNLTPNHACTDQNIVHLSGGNPSSGHYWSLNTPIWGDTLYPPVSGQGGYTIYYSASNQYGCSDTANALFTVYPIPTLHFPQINGPIYTNTQPFVLLAQPSGSVFTGNGVTYGGNGMYYFNPAIAGAGTHVITASNTHPISGCTAVEIQYATIIPSVGIEEYENTVHITGEFIRAKVIALTGQVIYDGKSNEISIAGLKPGPYVVIVTTSDGYSVQKKMVKH